MAQANDYPPSPWAKAGAQSLQNVALDGTTVMRCLADGTRFLGLGSAPTTPPLARSTSSRRCSRSPSAAVETAGALAHSSAPRRAA